MSAAPLAITLGDPAGIGPEIVAAAWSALRLTGPSFFAIGDAATIAATGCAVTVIRAPGEADASFGQALPVLDLPLSSPVIPGSPTSAAAPQVIAWIERAVALARFEQLAVDERGDRGGVSELQRLYVDGVIAR